MFYLNSRSDEVLWNCQDLKITFDLWEKIETFRKLFFLKSTTMTTKNSTSGVKKQFELTHTTSMNFNIETEFKSFPSKVN